MGTFLKGILGGFSGKVGNVIGACWRGIDYMRSLPRKSNKPPTIAQLTQRMIFAMIAGFFRPIGSLINVGYQSNKGKETPMNAALSYHIKNAVTGIYPNLTVDLPNVFVSKGTLLAPGLPEAASVVGGDVKFEWVNNAPVGSTNGTDKATVMVYNPMKNLFVALQDAAIRSALTYTLSLPSDFVGDSVHAWIYFVNAAGKQVSDSAYLGAVTVVA